MKNHRLFLCLDEHKKSSEKRDYFQMKEVNFFEEKMSVKK